MSKKNRIRDSKELKLIDMTIRAMAMYRDSHSMFLMTRESAMHIAEQASEDVDKLRKQVSEQMQENAQLRQQVAQLKMTILKAETIMTVANNYLGRNQNINPGSAVHKKIVAFLNKED